MNKLFTDGLYRHVFNLVLMYDCAQLDFKNKIERLIFLRYICKFCAGYIKEEYYDFFEYFQGNSKRSVIDAIKLRKMNICKYMYHKYFTSNIDMFKDSCIFGYLELSKYIYYYKYRIYPIPISVYKEIITIMDNLETIIWLNGLTSPCKYEVSSIFEKLISHGYKNVLEWFYNEYNSLYEFNKLNLYVNYFKIYDFDIKLENIKYIREVPYKLYSMECILIRYLASKYAFKPNIEVCKYILAEYPALFDLLEKEFTGSSVCFRYRYIFIYHNVCIPKKFNLYENLIIELYEKEDIEYIEWIIQNSHIPINNHIKNICRIIGKYKENNKLMNIFKIKKN